MNSAASLTFRLTRRRRSPSLGSSNKTRRTWRELCARQSRETNLGPMISSHLSANLSTIRRLIRSIPQLTTHSDGSELAKSIIRSTYLRTVLIQMTSVKACWEIATSWPRSAQLLSSPSEFEPCSLLKKSIRQVYTWCVSTSMARTRP